MEMGTKNCLLSRVFPKLTAYKVYVERTFIYSKFRNPDNNNPLEYQYSREIQNVVS